MHARSRRKTTASEAKQLPAVPEPALPPLAVTDAYRASFGETLADTYFSDFGSGYLQTGTGTQDLEDHLVNRMMEAETTTIPWIEECFALRGRTLIEIGSGTGSTTVPVALRAGSVRAYDISASSISAARERARWMGSSAIDFRLLDPDWAASDDNARRFVESESPVDAILFIALLEHLTIQERIRALRAAWKLLKPDGILVVYETPNRLGYFDWHSFQLPFFHWLPDELAIEYSTKTARPSFSLSREGDVVEHLYRLGRGVSFHEFELALGLEAFEVVNDGYSPKLQRRAGLASANYDGALEEIFRARLPGVPLGFVKPSLDLVLRKRRPGESVPRPPTPVPVTANSDHLKRRINEYELVLNSPTKLSRVLVRLTARELVAATRDPGQFARKVRAYIRRRVR